MRENGWRSISIDERLRAITYFDLIKGDLCRRDKKIIYYILYENLSGAAIARRNDPDIVGLGNRSYGKPLSAGAILDVFYKYYPHLKRKKKEAGNKRVELIMKRQKSESPHKKNCAFCGRADRLEEHHMIPLMMGGTNDDRNLVFLCHDCHLQVTKYQHEIKLRTKTD